MEGNKFLKMVAECHKIAILVPNFAPYSGDARVVEEQVKELEAFGKDVDVITLRTSELGKGKTVIELGMPKSLFFERLYRFLLPLDIPRARKSINYLKKYDLIISHLYPMNWLASKAKRKYGTKYIFWYHGISDPNLQPYLYERIYFRLFIYLTQMTTKNADHIVSVSRYARDEFKQYAGKDSEVIYNKPDLSKYHRGIDGSKIRAKWNLDSDPVILNVGRICPPKCAHLLIQAFQDVKKEIPDAKLILVGKPTYDYYCKQLQESADESTIFAGFVPDEELPYYYAACDLYATCSLWETYNIPVAEAQASGKPVVAFDIGPHPEILDSNGILIEKGNISSFSQACIQKLKEAQRGGIGATETV